MGWKKLAGPLLAGAAMVTPQERERVLRDRRLGAQMRRKW